MALGSMAASAVQATALSLALVAGTAGAQTRDEFCARAPAAGFEQPPNPSRAGRYANAIYGYAVRIPAPLVAHTGASGPERGFGIVLSWTPRAFLRVDASYDVFYDLTAAGVHRSDLNAIRVHDAVVADQVAPAALDHERGGRFRTQLRCAGDPALYVIEAILVVRRREVYRLQLQTTPERFERDHRVLEQLARSWRWQTLR
ncbi:MAG TPA: hypothetical protein VN859_07105 [Steroidobacteraceae bacterium]|nr:hypothetical protein [Steroidobacteraceae bacterium]